MHDTQAIAGTVVVENPPHRRNSGVGQPANVHPNLRKEITPAAMKNRAVSDVYEPGSTFKLVTISAA